MPISLASRLVAGAVVAGSVVAMSAGGSGASGAESPQLAALSARVTSHTPRTPDLTARAKAGPPPFKALPPGKHVTISFLTYLPSASGTIPATFKALMDSFEKLHPNITVNVETGAPGAGANLVSTLQQDEVAGHTPTVAQLTFDASRFLASGLGAQNLDEVVGGGELGKLWGGKHPYAPAIRKLGVVDGSVYGIPWTLSTPVLFYNADLFRKAGLNPEDPPRTWAEVKKDALAIKKATGADGLSNGCVGGGSSFDWCLQAIIDSAGGSVISPDGKKITFDSAHTIYALNELKDLAQSGAMVNLTTTQTFSEFASQKLAMVLTTSGLQSLLTGTATGHFTVFDTKMPGFADQRIDPTNSGSALYLFAKDREVQRAAWELIQYLTSAPAETLLTKGIGYPPLRPSLLQDPAYLETWASSDRLLQANMAQLEHIVPWVSYPGPNYSQIETTLMNAATNVVFQDAPTKSTMSQAQTQADGEMP